MKKIVLIATLFVAAYSVKAQGSGSPVPTPGTHVNADDISFTITSVQNGQSNNHNVVLLIEGYFVGLGSSAKGGDCSNTYSIDATLTVTRDCGPNPGNNVPPGLSRPRTKALGVGSSCITRNGRMPWSVEVHANGMFCPRPFVAAEYSFELTIEPGDGGFMVNGISVPLK